MSDDLQFSVEVAIALLVCALGLTFVAVGTGWAVSTFTTDTAVYELETGEYLHCTPQGGNNLECQVTHRKDTE